MSFRAIAPTRTITQQPLTYYRPINNSFNLLANEKVYREWEYSDEGCCCESSFYTILTDIRLLTRSEERTCCNGCSEPSRTDSATFLREFDQIRESHGEQFSCRSLFRALLTCKWPCYVGRRTCGPKQNYYQLLGRFGSELVQLRREDMPVAQVDMSTAIINSKLVGRS